MSAHAEQLIHLSFKDGRVWLVQHALRARYRAAHALCGALGWISRVASRGRLDVTHSDAIIVLSKAESEMRRTQYQVSASMARS